MKSFPLRKEKHGETHHPTITETLIFTVPGYKEAILSLPVLEITNHNKNTHNHTHTHSHTPPTPHPRTHTHTHTQSLGLLHPSSLLEVWGSRPERGGCWCKEGTRTHHHVLRVCVCVCVSACMHSARSVA